MGISIKKINWSRNMNGPIFGFNHKKAEIWSFYSMNNSLEATFYFSADDIEEFAHVRLEANTINIFNSILFIYNLSRI